MSSPDTPQPLPTEAPSANTMDIHVGQHSSDAASSPAEPGSRLLFLIVAIIAAVAFSIAAAHAPPRIRLLGLFLPAVGLLMATIMIQFAQRLKCRIGLLEVIIIGVTTFGGLIGSTLQSFRLEPIVKQTAELHPIAAAVEEQIRKSGGTPPADLQQSMIIVEHPLERFRNYLARRIQALGTWNRPWPEVFWIVEVLTGTLGAAWLGWHFGRQEAQP